MTRGTLANTRLHNELADGKEGGYTTYFPINKVETIFSASQSYQDQRTELLILAGKDYGMGSSRDWAAKGVKLLGVKAVIAESYERIHRSNLVMMGVVPLQFKNGQNAEQLGLDGREIFEINLPLHFTPRQWVEVRAKKQNDEVVSFEAKVRFDSKVEIAYYQSGGILNKILADKMAE